MLCAACGARTPTSPCRSCGHNPLLKGRYRLLDLLSGADHAMEYRAVDARASDKPLLVRLRPIAPALAQHPASLSAMAISMRGMDHPAVQPWLDAFLVGDGATPSLCVISAEPVGVPLSAELTGQAWPLSRVLSTLEELLSVAAHVHRLDPPVALSSLDPTRVLRRADGALLLTHAAPPALAQHAGADPVCEAPERRRGLWTPSSDVYAIATLGVGLLLGRHPRHFADPGGFLVWNEAARDRGPIVELLSRWMSPDPAARPASATAALHALQRMTELTPSAAPEPTEAATVLVAAPPLRDRPTFEYAELETQTESALRARRAALERTTGAFRLSEPTTGMNRALGRNTDITRIQPVPAQVVPEQVVAQSTLGARVITVALSITIAAAAVLALQSISSRMGWIDSDPWVQTGGNDTPTPTASGLKSRGR